MDQDEDNKMNEQDNNPESKDPDSNDETTESAPVQEEMNEDQEVNENKEEDLISQIEELKEEKIRLLAEMENLRKRFEREKVETIKFGSINLARDILSPGDNLERALNALSEGEKYSTNIKNLIEGLKMVSKEFRDILNRHGVKKIETSDTKFDHNFHQAIMEIENDVVEEGTVVQEIQAGYTMHNRLLRAAMVGVAKKTSLDNKDEKEDIEKKANKEDDKNKE